MIRPLAVIATLVVSCFAKASMIEIGSVREIRAAEPGAVQTIRDRCGKLSLGSLSAKKACSTISDDAIFAAGAADFCASRSDHEFEPCVHSIRGKAFSENVLSICRQTGNGKGSPKGLQCLDYFSKSQSRYDSELVKFCFKNQGNPGFGNSVSCLNSIRDRAIDSDAITKECAEPKKTLLGFPTESVFECVERVAVSAPLLSCGNSPATKAKDRSSSTSGQR